MMQQACKLTVWGVRGSFPRSEKEYLGYGGNTSCFSLEWGEKLIVLDGGSGLARLGEALAGKGGKEIHILFSHLHMDHVMGLLYFAPMFHPETQIHLYGGSQGKDTLRISLERLFRNPYWPLEIGDFPAGITFHDIEAGQGFCIGSGDGIAVDILSGCHPGGSLLYRLKCGGRSVVYTLDCETDREMENRLAKFSQNADILIWDAHFAPADFKKGWGHSTWRQGISVKQAAGCGQILMTHYSWDYTDDFLKEQERLASAEDKGCKFAREGMEIKL